MQSDSVLLRNSLLLHVGSSKTGSTSLQNMLFRNRIMLAREGISYRDTRNLYHSVQSGNGENLGVKLRQNATKSEIKKIISTSMDPDCLSVISHEGISTLPKPSLELLFNCLDELEVNFKVLIYVRSPIDYYLSSFNQAVKRHGYSQNFERFTETNQWGHLNSLRCLDGLRPDADLRVVLYDNECDHLFQSFWGNVYSMFGVELQLLIPEDEKKANRALNVDEVNLLTSINHLFKDSYSTLISDFLIESNTAISTKPQINRKIAANLMTRHEHDIEWVNTKFLEGQNNIPSTIENYQFEERKNSKRYPDSKTMLQLVLFILRNIDEAVIETGDRTLKALREKISNSSYYDEMEDGSIFDNVYYLINNQDVITSAYSPLQHFRKWGQEEKRSWRVLDSRIGSAQFPKVD